MVTVEHDAVLVEAVKLADALVLVDDGVATLGLRHFQIVTLRLRPAAA